MVSAPAVPDEEQNFLRRAAGCGLLPVVWPLREELRGSDVLPNTYRSSFQQGGKGVPDLPVNGRGATSADSRVISASASFSGEFVMTAMIADVSVTTSIMTIVQLAEEHAKLVDRRDCGPIWRTRPHSLRRRGCQARCNALQSPSHRGRPSGRASLIRRSKTLA